MFFISMYVMHTSIFKKPASKLIIYAQILLANARILCMYVAINPDSKYVYRNIAIHINFTCICIHICLTRSLKNPYQGQININCENCCL